MTCCEVKVINKVRLAALWLPDDRGLLAESGVSAGG